MKKKLLSLLLAGVMAAGIFAGCGESGKETDANKDDKEVEVDTQESDKGSESEEKELTTVKILCKNDFSADLKTEDWEEFPVSQVVIQDLEEIGIRLELECIDNDSFADVVNTRMASGVDIPDLIAYCWAGNEAQDVLDWAESGLVYSVDELVEQYDEDGSIRKFYDEKFPTAWELTTAKDGKVYWFSYLVAARTYVDKETGLEYQWLGPSSLNLRKDWVEAVGEELQDVYTPDELFDILKKIQDGDANGNGVADEVVHLDITNFKNYIATGFDMSMNLLAGYRESDNTVFSNFYHENFPAYIKFMQSLVENDLYDTVTLSATADEMLAENRISAISGYSIWSYEASIPSADEATCYYPIIIDMDDDATNGFPFIVDPYCTFVYNQYFVPKACENPEAVTRLMDYVYTERYVRLNNLGIEGVNYEIDESGNIVMLTVEDPARDVTFASASAGLYALPAMGYEGTVKDNTFSGDDRMSQKERWLFKFETELYPDNDQIEFSAPSLALPNDEESQFISEKLVTLETYASELLTDLILGNKSLDNLADYQKELEDLGLQEYINILQARRNRAIGAE